MHAEVIKFKVKSGREDDTKAVAAILLKELKSSKGFVSSVIYYDEEANEWGRTTVWETKEDQVAWVNSITPEQRERNTEPVDGPPEVKRCDVIGYATAD